MKDLDYLKKRTGKETVSAVIPTYNRCLRKDDIRFNPPWWAAVSLSSQENIGEIIFVDDGSRDYTEEVIKQIDERLPVDIVYLKNEKNLGLPASRNKGVQAAKYDKIWFMDDDCVIISKDVLPKLEYAFNLLKNQGVKVGSMSLPVSGNSLESEIFSSSEIGKVGKETGIMYACNSKFPKEYLEKPEENYLDINKGIFKPLNVEFSHAVFLCDKRGIEEVGGFKNLSWKNAHTEEAQFLMRLNKKGYGIFYLPSLEREFRVFHCRYGDSDFNRIPYNFSVDGISFNEILKESAIKRMNNGCRVSQEEYLYSHVLSEMSVMFNHYNEGLGVKNLQSKYKKVLEGKFFPQIGEGVEIFRKAVEEGIVMLEKNSLISEETKQSICLAYLQ
jgi:glycosyltransferase involved in cell wall biosynthesis